MENKNNELKQLFPTAKEVKIADKVFFVKPMVWTDIVAVVESIVEAIAKINDKNPDLDLEKFDIKKDLIKLIPITDEILNIFARWLKVDYKWLKDSLTIKNLIQLLQDFIDINEINEVKSLFFGLKLKVQEVIKK